MFCNKCGKKIEYKGNYCERCGEKLDFEATGNQNLSSASSTIAPAPKLSKKKFNLLNVIIPIVSICLIVAIGAFAYDFITEKDYRNYQREINNNGNENNTDKSNIFSKKNEKKDGTATAKKENIKTKVAQMQEAGSFDEILCSGDEFYLVKKTEDNYDGFKVLVGVVNSNGEWVHNLSATNVFAEAMVEESKKTTINGSKVKMTSKNFKYMGDGIFVASMGVIVNYPGRSEKIGTHSSFGDTGLDCYFFNVKENAQTSFEATHITPYDEGYMLMYQSKSCNSNFYNVNTKGEITELPCKYDSWSGLSFPAYSDGVFFAEKKFFDIQGNVVLDISKYNLYGQEYGEDTTPPHFENGKCTIKFRNDGGTLYKAVIDKQGSFIEEPTKIAEND